MKRVPVYPMWGPHAVNLPAETRGSEQSIPVKLMRAFDPLGCLLSFSTRVYRELCR